MKYKLNIFLSLIVSLISCTDNHNGETPQGLLSFSIRSGSTVYQGAVDDGASAVFVGGITQASEITGVEYVLSEGAVIMPDPKAVEEWKEEQRFEVTLADGGKRLYTVYLKDLKAEEEPEPEAKHVVIGYIPGADWEYDAEFKNIRWDYLTHVNVSFLYVTAEGDLLDGNVSAHLEEIRTEAHKHGVKVLISLQSDGNQGFAKIIKTDAGRKKLAANAVKYAQDHQLDGIDVDFEIYDAVGPNLLAFVKELHHQKGEELLQTCAVATWNAGQGYSTEWHRYFDYINLMAYDFTGGWGKEGAHASFDQAVGLINLWLTTLQAPAEKLVLGLPFYGYSWDNLPGLDDVKAIRYHQILAQYPGEDVANRDQVGRTYYNGKPTLIRKCTYVKEHGLAGVMIWQLFQDAKSDEESLLKVVGEEMNTEN